MLNHYLLCDVDVRRGEEKLRARNESKKAELNEQLKDVINEWRKNRSKEEEELQKVDFI